MRKFTLIFSAVLAAALAGAGVADTGALLDVYSNKQTSARPTSSVSVQSMGVRSTACTDAVACLAQCSTDPLLNQDMAVVQDQLIQCTNNMRLAPGLFQTDISAVCNFDDVQGAAAGLSALQSSPALSSVAQAHSDDMAAQNYFSHFSSNGSSPYDRVHSVVPTADFVIELTAAGWPSVRSVLVQLVCSAKHRSVLMSCAYDSIGWGAHFAAAASPQQQWHTYITADLICTTAAGCTCKSLLAQPTVATPSPAVAADQSPATAVPSPMSPPTPAPPPTTPAAATAAPAPLAFPPAVPVGASTPGEPTADPTLQAGPGALPAVGTAPPEAPTPLITFDAAVPLADGASRSDIESSLVAAVSAAAAPIHVTVTVLEAAPASPGQRRLLQTTWTMQATVNFTIGNLTAGMGEGDLTAIVTHDVAVFLQPIGVVASESASSVGDGVEYAFSGLLPPNNQIGDQQAGSGALQASSLSDALQHAPGTALPSLAAVSAFTVAGVDTQVAVVQAQAGPAPAGIIPALPPMQGLLAAAPPQPAAPPAAPPISPTAPAAQPIVYSVRVLFPASQAAAAEALLAAVTSLPSIFPSSLHATVSNAVLLAAVPQVGAPGAGIESAGSQGGSNGVSGALYATSMELSAGPPKLPRSSGEEALLVAALQGTPVPLLAAADVAVALHDAAGGNGTAAVYAFGPSQPGIYLVAVTSPANYTGQVVVSLPNIVAVAPLTYLVAGPSATIQARATAWRLPQLML